MDTEAAIGQAREAGARELRLSGALEELPRGILALADTLEVLDLSGNGLRAIPDWIADLPRLRILFLSGNAFEEVPAALAGCRALRMLGLRDNRIRRWDEDALPEGLGWLVLTGNRLERLPDSIGRLRGLRKLMLAGNRLEALPDAMADCTGLELLRLSANGLRTLPPWLRELPRLAWLAYAGNPGTPAFAHRADSPTSRDGAPAAAPRSELETLAWHELAIGDRLGEGASGIIRRASRSATCGANRHTHWRGELSTAADRAANLATDLEHLPTDPSADLVAADLAVKVFKGGLTSDGFPEDELSACIAAGRHRHLVPLVGPVVGHPEGRAALALGLVPPDHVRLGAPPDFETCTRDTFAPGTVFDLATILRVARAIASAGAHLHDRGILHGDLYAHNILFSPEGGVLLGDFGAASPLPADGSCWAERIEVRAYGCLLDDLLARQARPPRTAPGGDASRSAEHPTARGASGQGDHDAAAALAAPTAPMALAALAALRDRCLDPRPESRPLFPEILAALPAN